MLEQLLCVPEVCAYLKTCRPRRSFSGLMEKQVLLHRAYMLVIPRAMQTAIDRNNMTVSVIAPVFRLGQRPGGKMLLLILYERDAENNVR